MRFFIFSVIVICCFFYCSSSVSNDDHKNNTLPEKVDVFEQNKKLGRGINLGNALEAPAEGDWGITLEAQWFKIIKDAGFNSVRIPIRWSAHALESFPYTIDPQFMSRIKWAVDLSLENDLAVVINIHHFEEIFSEPDQQKARFLEMWKQITTAFLNKPSDLMFEILNEPHDNLSAEKWNDFFKNAVSVIRQIDTSRTLIFMPAEWGGSGAINKLEIPDDDNLIFSFHFYNPFSFTHQGAEWVENSNDWLGTRWLGTADEKKAIEDEFNFVKSWAEQNNVPVYIGEFGAYNKADLTSRSLWTSFVTRTAESMNMSWAYWEFAAGFGVYDKDSQKWNAQLLQALVPGN